MLGQSAWGSIFKYIIICVLLILALFTVLANITSRSVTGEIRANIFLLIIAILWAYLNWHLAAVDFNRTQAPSGILLAVAASLLTVEGINMYINKHVEAQAEDNTYPSRR